MILLHDRAASLVSLSIILFGGYVVWAGLEMPMGNLRRIGPGFFPVMLGLAMVGLGIATLLEPPQPRPSRPAEIRALAFVLFAILAFGLLVRSLGLAPATLALVLLATLGQQKPSLTSALGTAAGLCLIGYLVFILGLDIPVELFAEDIRPGRD
jgi:hypothetical protein